jgi:hypothetical protein
LSYHRFKIAQTVTSTTPDMPPGPFVIVRLLPRVGGEPRYRLMSTIDGHQRVMLESQIRSMAEQETASVRLVLSCIEVTTPPFAHERSGVSIGRTSGPNVKAIYGGES